ncbi:hypothetical protein D4764_13G0012450 [Takifugu flavidus]|uniref:Uncharacterized protein n=1 Tax=Takifugu flavidus TaxID=433684 RepID=A0A5C6PAP2_9TELE|nr:hypothetical protein D4764_13G0012450 [Takifugu flavidus]
MPSKEEEPKGLSWKDKSMDGKAYMEWDNQVSGIVYRSICTEYGLEVPGSRWETPLKVPENKHAKIQWDFQIQTDKMVWPISLTLWW